MAEQELAVKKYVVRLRDEERQRLSDLIRQGKSPAQRLLKARLFLKADVAGSGAGWSDRQSIQALETSTSLGSRVRKHLVEEGCEAVLSRTPRATPAVPRIFDGAKEARCIAVACAEPPPGRVRWTLRVLEAKVVALHSVEHASDHTRGRT